MSSIVYDPDDVGKQIISKFGTIVTRRKYHMTDDEKALAKSRWLKEVKEVHKSTRKKAGKLFFNPYRKGIYYYQLQSLFLLGANQWHSFPDILQKMEKIMSAIPVRLKSGEMSNAWLRFRGKSERDNAIRCKSYMGRIQENFVFFQRLGQRHPYRYKLKKVGAAVDMKRISRRGMPSGIYFYRLHTYPSTKRAFPIRDYRRFKFVRHERKHISSRFIGTIITKHETIKLGITNVKM